MLEQYPIAAPQDRLHCIRSSLLAGIPHGMFCCGGGVSRPPFAGLNLSSTVGDSPVAVRRNRERVKQVLGIRHLASAIQVHGRRIALVATNTADQEYADTDALITNQSGVGLLIQQADCQAVLLHDPQRKAIAAIHNGWRGSAANILAATVRALEENFRVHPADLRAVISPSLGPCCSEFLHYAEELPETLHRYQVKENYFDFWAISRRQLADAGVRSEYIETVGVCTVCNRNFFSYRRAMRQPESTGKTGRNGSVISLP
ncbi:MAG: peptidoglycan editing factor PgeF [Candidatus Electrothrix sp. YB6]